MHYVSPLSPGSNPGFNALYIYLFQMFQVPCEP